MRARDLGRERLALTLRADLDDPAAGPGRRERLAEHVDAWLREVWAGAAPRSRGGAEGIALAAVGSHARRTAGPASDLDLVLVHDGRSRGPGELAAAADALWYPIWDSGVRLDHAVRSVAQCREVARADAAAAVGLLDLRPLAGDAAVVLAAREAVRSDWRRRAPARLPPLLDAAAERARAHGELAHLLEGDLKESHGGLRDVVVLRAVAASWVADLPHGELGVAATRLLDVRDALQAVTGRPGDRLVLQEQDAVAAGLGLEDADALLALVAGCARTVVHALDATARRARGAVASRRGLRRRAPVLRPLGGELVEHEGELWLSGRAHPVGDPVLGVRAAAAAARRGIALSPVTAEHLAAAARGDGAPMPLPWPDAARDALVDLLGAGPAQVPVWETLDQAGLVTSWLPAWEGVRNRPQRTAVHRFTVDRHLVETAVECAPLLSRVSRPDLLLVAALLHDVGKVAGAADHSVTGAPVAREAAARLGWSEADADLVGRLVRHHLTLVELATRRDPDDAGTVAALVEAVDGREDVLDVLRALTEADARAAGPAAWTPWRRRLVDDLVARSREVLRGEALPGPPPLSAAERAASAEVAASGCPQLRVEDVDGLSAVSVVAPDRAGLFADVAGLLASHRLGVRSALVRTVEGVAVDRWWVDAASASSGVPEASVLLTGLRRLAAGDTTVLEPMRRRDASWRPERSVVAWQVAAPPRVLLVSGASREATVVEVRAMDRPGLLHALGSALVGVGVQVGSAHVATYGGQAVDVLYLHPTGPDGAAGSGPLDPPLVARAVSALAQAAGVGAGPDAGGPGE